MVLGFLVVVPIVGLVLGIMTAVDVSKYPEWAFGQIGASKTVWQILPVVLGLFCFGIGGIVMYFMWTGSRRDIVARAAYSGPPPYYGYPPPSSPQYPQYPPPPPPPPSPPPPGQPSQ